MQAWRRLLVNIIKSLQMSEETSNNPVYKLTPDNLQLV